MDGSQNTSGSLIVLDPPAEELQGFCNNYTACKHSYESLAEQGIQECREDWARYIGPIGSPGGANPQGSCFGALTLPTSKPERTRIINYIFEYAFLYDNLLESAAKAQTNESNELGFCEFEDTAARSKIGSLQVQSKMMLEMLQLDKGCAEVVIDAWKTMIRTTADRDKSQFFEDIEAYVEYRIIDTGAPFVEKLMLFGLGMTLTEDETEMLAPVVQPCFAALGLANDYFSFDVEYQEFRTSDSSMMTNAVWLYTRWYGVDIPRAKEMVKEQTLAYERRFIQLWQSFIASEPAPSTKLKEYLQALSYQVPGNVIWSLTCPRYQLRPGLLISDQSEENPSDSGHERQDSLLPSGDEGPSKCENSPVIRALKAKSSDGFAEKRSGLRSLTSISPALLDDRKVLAPFQYLISLPSKGVRDLFIDALRAWLPLAQTTADNVKDVINTLHSASLMLDDIEDNSELRRGRPATHVVFGIGQTINSAGYLSNEALGKVLKLGNLKCVQIFQEELRMLYLGQSYDVYWTQAGESPSEDEYLSMVDMKTGGLFRLMLRLMEVLCPETRVQCHGLNKLVMLLGRYFQIRDDYQNLNDAEYTQQKGFCDDLDEGKYSHPLIHALWSDYDAAELSSLLHERSVQGYMSEQGKKRVLEHLRLAGSMEYTLESMLQLEHEMLWVIESLEQSAGWHNWALRLLLFKLKVM